MTISFWWMGSALAMLAWQAAPAAPAPCAGAEYRQFDFWLGEWEVESGGKRAGTNRITRIQGGCALLEDWTGAEGTTGMSLNLYDPANKKWHQMWIDSDGLALFLEGELKDGKMTLASGPMPTRDGQVSRHRITWSSLPEGRVRQLWEQSTDQGRSWSVVFEGIYVPRSPRH
ncbi:MAG: hypothetical protein L0191_02685 [Acidobacteria bacterium]|nr:hypothetical protein [Acidobacteriota bacterium]